MLHKRVIGLFLRRLRLFIFGAQQGVSLAWLSKQMVIYPNLQSLQESREREFASLKELDLEAKRIYESIVSAKSGKVTNEN
jgi:hypothetical protein